MQPGIHPELSNHDYHVGEGISKTGLCRIEKAPRLYRHMRDNPGQRKITPALRTGSIFHIVMEGAFERDCVIGPDVADKRAGEWKAFVKANPDRIAVTPEEALEMKEMREAMWSFGPAREYLSTPGFYECSFFWIDPATGLLCKCRPDWISADYRVILDFKTAADASEEQFGRSASNNHYEVSAAMTIDGVYHTTGILPDLYRFLAIEPLPPHLVSASEATADDLRDGRDFIRRNLSRLKRCMENGTWPGLPEEIRALNVARYRRKPVALDSATEDDSATLGELMPEKYWECG